jgi:hypothetical protein
MDEFKSERKQIFLLLFHDLLFIAFWIKGSVFESDCRQTTVLHKLQYFTRIYVS